MGGGESEEVRNGTNSSSSGLLSPTSQDSLLVVDCQNRPQSYILYEGEGREDQGYIHVQREFGEIEDTELCTSSIRCEGYILGG